MNQRFFRSYPLLIALILPHTACERAYSDTDVVSNPAARDANTSNDKESQTAAQLQPGHQTIALRQTIQGKEQDRHAIVHTPKGFTPTRKYPAVFALHGNGGNAKEWPRRLAPFIDKDGWIGIYPQGIQRSWNLGTEESKADDVAFISQLVAMLDQYPGIDMSRLFIIGISNGAGMAHKLAIETSHFKGIATIVTSLSETNRPHPKTTPVSVLQILGMKDKLIPYAGGPSRVGHNFLSAEESAQVWASTNGCSLPPRKSTTRFGNEKIEYSGCKNQARVIHYGDPRAGHRIPKAFEGGLMKVCLDFFRGLQ